MEPPTSLHGRNRRSRHHTYNETNPNLMNSHRRSKSRGRASSRSRSKSRGRSSRNELQLQQQPSPIDSGDDRLATPKLQLDNGNIPTRQRSRSSRSKSRNHNNNLNSKATAALEKAYKNASNEKDILINNTTPPPPPPPPRIEYSLAQHLSTNGTSTSNYNKYNRGRSSRSLDVRNTHSLLSKNYNNNKSSSKSCVNYNYNYKDNPPPPPPPRSKDKEVKGDGKVREGQQVSLFGLCGYMSGG